MNWPTALTLLYLTCACHRTDPTGRIVPVRAEGATFGATVHLPARLSSVDVGKNNTQGQPIRIRCETCHSLRSDAPVPTRMEALKDFHTGMSFAHGPIECRSCHAQGQPPALHLASGESLPTTDALRLCAQCHGPQFRDYEHGAHGGMTGYWDTTRGPRVRNHCVDCHDPHTPQIVPVVPLPRPRDRFFNTGGH